MLWILLVLCLFLSAGAWWLGSGRDDDPEAPAEYVPSREDQQAMAEAQALLDRGHLLNAEAVLARLPEGYLAGDLLKALVAQRIEDAEELAALKHEARIQELLAQSEAARQKADWAAARAPLDEIIRVHDPANAAAAAALRQIEADTKRVEQDRAILEYQRVFAEAEATLGKGDHAGAETRLAAVPAAFADAAAVNGLRSRIQIARLAAEQARLGAQQRSAAEARKPPARTPGRKKPTASTPTPKATKPGSGSQKPPAPTPAPKTRKPGTPRPHSFLTM